MYKIGEFSAISKTTIKALRYYEKEKLLMPSFIDPNTGYRYYDTEEFVSLNKIISLRQVGMSIKDIKEVLNNNNMKQMLQKRKKEIVDNLNTSNTELSKINYLLEEENMKSEIVVKELPSYTVYYKEGVLKNIAEITNFILASGAECLELNPKMKCIEPDYCYVNYLDGEYKEKNIKIRYVQAVKKSGVESDSIKFMKLKPVKAVCLFHKGSYETIRESYNMVFKYIKENDLEVLEDPRERYIDGVWNKDDVNDYLTEIEVPIK